MRSCLATLLLCLAFNAAAADLPWSAQTLANVSALRDAALTDERAYQWVEQLVTHAGPRFCGTPGNRKAVAWAVRELKVRGFANVHTEPVVVPDWRRGKIDVQIVGDDAQSLVAAALGGSVATPAPGIEAPVLLVTSLEDLRARPLADIAGKIVFFNARMTRRADGGDYGATVPVRTRGPAEAGRRGALAVVIRSVGTSRERVAHTGATRYDDAAPKIPAAALSNVDADLLEARLGAGPVRIKLKLDSAEHKPVMAANVVADIPGQSKDIVLLGAHLDSWDITPGANDDGAGTAIVVEAARRIGALRAKPKRTIRVVLFANEEFGLSGAKAYAQRHRAELSHHVLALEADFGSGAVQELASGVPDASDPLVTQMLAQLAPLSIIAGERHEAGGADIGELHQRGVPTLAPRQDGTHYFDVHHTGSDTPDKIDRAGLTQNVAVYATLAYLAAQMDGNFGRVPVMP